MNLPPGVVLRTWHGVEVHCFRIGQVAKMLNKTVQIIRYWETQGYIPKPVFPGEKRVYLPFQVTLMMALSNALDEARYDPKRLREVHEKMSAYVAERWEGQDG